MFSEKQSHEMGVKASAAEAGQYTMEPGVLAYYEVCEVLNKNTDMKIYWHPEVRFRFRQTRLPNYWQIFLFILFFNFYEC